MKALLIVAAIALAPWVLASLVVCAPAWYAAKRGHRYDGNTDTIGERFGAFMHRSRRGPNLRWIILVATCVPAVVCLALLSYGFHCWALIERKCPYGPRTSDIDLPSVNDWLEASRDAIAWARANGARAEPW